ncbi:MAG: PQQ-dependent sugar dehydrogenase [Ardenticatenaceae bacterium]
MDVRLLGLVLALLLVGCASAGRAEMGASTSVDVSRSELVIATPTTALPGALRLELVAKGLEQPVGVVHAGDGSGRLFVMEKAGTVRIQEGERLHEVPFLDIRERVSTRWERGLLGLAFEPGRPKRFYVHYTNRAGNSVIARYRVSESYPDAALAGGEEILLTVEQPAANHNGGHLLFGPDGYLWIGLGDGGEAGDYFGNGQNRYTLLGSLLRLDVRGDEGYRVPPDNPFAQDEEAGSPAIWAIGLRNPWRFSFDRLTGDLWLADVGQYEWEEINHVPSDLPGLNFGWPVMEGFHCYEAQHCNDEGSVLPVAEYNHDEGCAVSGGYVYRGRAIPSLWGYYVFGDFCSGRIWAIPASTEPPASPLLLRDSDLAITSFGEDEAGELYVTDYDGGLYRVIGK